MDTGSFLEALKEFFLDAVGSVVPGVFALIGLALVVPDLQSTLERGLTSFGLIVLVVTYIVGNGLLGISRPLEQILGSIGDRLGSTRFQSKQRMARSIQRSDSYREFRRLVGSSIGEDESASDFHNWRSEAMTIASEEKHIVYRFMFISLFHSGVATTLTLIPVLWLILLALGYYLELPFSVLHLPTGGGLVMIVSAFVLSAPFWSRSFEFRARSLRVPFPMASASLRMDDTGKSTSDAGTSVGDGTDRPESFTRKRLTVYLAGGFRSRWQDNVKDNCAYLNIIDPSQHGLDKEDEYTAWDLEAIRGSDVVFAYAEATNPSLYGLSLEVGFAKALGKTIILVDEKTDEHPEVGKYLGMVRASSDVYFKRFDAGVDYLNQLQKTADQKKS